MFILTALMLVSCTKPDKAGKPSYDKDNNREIPEVWIWPSDACTLRTGEKLYIRYTFKVPEELCRIWVTPSLPANYWNAHTNHGLVLGNSSSPVYAFGEGMVEQSISLFYNPKKDAMGRHSLPDPAYIMVTNIAFSLKDHNTGNYRILMNKSVAIKWICEKN